ncbi:MAG: Thermostable carboxypeptidase 1 [Phycisphaerae bacterium]|nr:Thermostable carboxypeptidase 1 [Phycisphaerae bacterium]
MSSSTYSQFVNHVRDIHRAQAIESVLEWDQETCMPRRGAAERAEQLALIAGIVHDRRTSDEFGGMIQRLAGSDAAGQDHVAATNIREMKRQYERAVRIPRQLVQELARTVALAKGAWVEAKRDSDFAKFAPHVERLLDLKRQVADLVGWGEERYDALMDEYEPGATSAAIQRVFDQLRAELVPFIQSLGRAPRQPDRSLLARHCPQAAQAELSRRFAAAIGFNFDAGRIDVSAHPFCSGTSPHDVRLTTRYREDYFPSALFGTLHEAGHGMYEQGLDPAHVGTPMGWAVSLGIHESQSLMWENMVGRSRPFWEHFYPDLQTAFPAMKDVPLDAFYFAVNAVTPSFIRVEADEATYNLHIVLRFGLERQMIAGTLAVRDIPDAWNAGMRDLLGVTPTSDAVGCLQDIHWSQGTFGYFPTYALGKLYAAQFFAAARRAMPDLDGTFRRGDFGPLLDWLRSNIHRHGQRYRAHELVKVVTGAELSHRPFMDYLAGKFRPLYGI